MITEQIKATISEQESLEKWTSKKNTLRSLRMPNLILKTFFSKPNCQTLIQKRRYEEAYRKIKQVPFSGVAAIILLVTLVIYKRVTTYELRDGTSSAHSAPGKTMISNIFEAASSLLVFHINLIQGR